VNAAAGNDTFDITTYDGPNGQGNRLSHATVQVAVSASGTTVNATLSGIVSSLAVGSTPWTASLIDGTPGTVKYTIDGVDAAGNTIVGAFDQPMQVSLVDAAAPPTVGLSLSAPAGSSSNCSSSQACTVNESGDVITASYTGASDSGGASLVFSRGSGGASFAVASIGMFPASLSGGAGFPASGITGLVAWYDAQDFNSIVQSAPWPTSITKLLDKSANHNDLAASVNAGVVAPSVDPSGFSSAAGRPAPTIDFAAGGSCLGPASGFPTNSDYSIVALLTPASDTHAIVAGNPPAAQSYAGHHFQFDPNDTLLDLVQNETPVVKEAATNASGSIASGMHAVELDYSHSGHVGTLVPDLKPGSRFGTQIGGAVTLVGTPVAGDTVSVTINGGTPIRYTVTSADLNSGDALGAIAKGLAAKIAGDAAASKVVTATGFSVNDANNNYLGEMPVKATSASPFTLDASTTSTGMKALLGDNTVDSSLYLNCINNPQNTSDTGSNHIQEVMVFNHTLSATDRKNLQTYLNRKWGLNYGAGF
jgi:hypothetical protein